MDNPFALCSRAALTIIEHYLAVKLNSLDDHKDDAEGQCDRFIQEAETRTWRECWNLVQSALDVVKD